MTYTMPNGYKIQVFHTMGGAWFDVRNTDDISVSMTHIVGIDATRDMIDAIERSAR